MWRHYGAVKDPHAAVEVIGASDAALVANDDEGKAKVVRRR